MRDIWDEKKQQHVFALEPVTHRDAGYLDALVQELERLGFRAAIVGEAHKELLLMVSEPPFTKEAREQILGEVIHLPETEVPEAITFLKSEVEWQRALAKIKEKLLKNI